MNNDDRRPADTPDVGAGKPISGASAALPVSRARMPRWVRMLLLIGVVLAVLVVAMLLSGHGPAQHIHHQSSPANLHLFLSEIVQRSALIGRSV